MSERQHHRSGPPLFVGHRARASRARRAPRTPATPIGWVASAKKETTRRQRLAELIETSERGVRIAFT